MSEPGGVRRSRVSESPGVIPGVLSTADLHAVQDHFGVDESQVRRDHVISHCLAALASIDDEHLLFFGGTALSRTHLPSLRLSEDIDLIARAPSTLVASEIQDALTTALRPVLGAPAFTPALLDVPTASRRSCQSETCACRSNWSRRGDIRHGRRRKPIFTSATPMRLRHGCEC